MKNVFGFDVYDCDYIDDQNFIASIGGHGHRHSIGRIMGVNFTSASQNPCSQRACEWVESSPIKIQTIGDKPYGNIESIGVFNFQFCPNKDGIWTNENTGKRFEAIESLKSRFRATEIKLIKTPA